MIQALLLVAAMTNAQTILDRVLENRAQKDFSLKARLFVTREQVVPVEVLVKNTAHETRTIYRAGTNEVLVVQPARGVPRMETVFGSQFTVYDLSLPFLQWKDAKFLGDDRLRGRDCHVLEVKATGQPYARVKLWIDREYMALLRADAFDENNIPVKRLAVTSFKRIGEAW